MNSTTIRDAILNTSRATAFAAWTPYFGLLDAVSSLRTPAGTETTYTGYGTRPSCAMGAPANTSPAGGRQVANTGLITLPQNNGADHAVIAWGLWDAATAGNLKVLGFLESDSPIIGTADTGDLITAPAHGFQADERVFVLASPGAPLPTGLAEDTAYYVLATGLTTDAFKLSASSGGAAVDITAAGAAMFIPYTPVTILANATPEFAIGSIIWQQ